MLYCDNDILIFDEPYSGIAPQEIHELMKGDETACGRRKIHYIHYA